MVKNLHKVKGFKKLPKVKKKRGAKCSDTLSIEIGDISKLSHLPRKVIVSALALVLSTNTLN